MLRGSSPSGDRDGKEMVILERDDDDSDKERAIRRARGRVFFGLCLFSNASLLNQFNDTKVPELVRNARAPRQRAYSIIDRSVRTGEQAWLRCEKREHDRKHWRWPGISNILELCRLAITEPITQVPISPPRAHSHNCFDDDSRTMS